MENQNHSKVKIVGFKQLNQGKQSVNLKRLSYDQPLINVVLIEISGTQNEKQKLKECQKWIKGYERIRLWKVSQHQAFKCIYQQMMKQPLPTYFISLLPIEEIIGQPIQKLYQQQLKEEGSLNTINQTIKDNIQRIKFIILKDNLQTLSKKNYFHGGIALITNRNDLIYEFFEEKLKKYGSQRPFESTSSINSQDMRLFAEEMDRVDSEGIALLQQKYQKKTNSDSQAWRLMNSNPGVGSYNISKFPS